MGLLDYIKANTPRASTPRVSPLKVINEGLLNPNQYNATQANRLKDSMFGLLGIVPGVGDAAAAVESADLFNRGQPLAGGLAALGALPMIPSIAAVTTGYGVDNALLNRLNKVAPNADAYVSGNDDLLTLQKIVIPKYLRGQGEGTRFMNELTSYADETGKTVALSPSSDFGGNKKRLEQFYKQQGFIKNKGKNQDFAISESMIRQPHKGKKNPR